MTGIEKYIPLLEEYCLGLLSEADAAAMQQAAKQFPQLQQGIHEMETSLVRYAGTTPRPSLKQNIFSALDHLPAEHSIDISNPPFIDRNSYLAEWQEAVASITADKDYDHIKVHFLKDTPEFQLCVAWLTGTLDEDEHHADEFAESFFILEGTCRCDIGGTIIHLKAGDYLDIPFNTHHTITSTSADGGYVKALIQRKKIAA
ncbi:cupin domain-containing protein [Ferruginibacter sp.]